MADGKIVQIYHPANKPSVWVVAIIWFPWSKVKDIKDTIPESNQTGMVIQAESGHSLVIGKYNDDGSIGRGVLGGGRILAYTMDDGKKPSGKVTTDPKEGTEWALRKIPVGDAKRIKESTQDPVQRQADASAILDAGIRRDSTAQKVVNAAEYATSLVPSAARGAVNLVDRAQQGTFDVLKGFIAGAWDDIDPWIKGGFAGLFVGGVDWLWRENVGEAIVVGGIAGGGAWFWASRGQSIEVVEVPPEILAKALNQARSKGYESLMVQQYGTIEKARAREAEWTRTGEITRQYRETGYIYDSTGVNHYKLADIPDDKRFTPALREAVRFYLSGSRLPDGPRDDSESNRLKRESANGSPREATRQAKESGIIP